MRLESGDAGNAATPSREEPGRPPQRSEFELEVIFYLNKREAETICRALTFEAIDIPSKRASAEISAEAGNLILKIRAMDPVALRAALNSFIRFIDACLRSLRFLEL